MHLECPKCFKDNEIEPKEAIVCRHCSEDISDYKYKRPIVSAFTALAIGAGSFYAADKYIFSEGRYPLPIEYEIIESCVSSHQKPMMTRHFKKKQSLCICALGEVMKDISYQDLNDKEINFIGLFERKVDDCR